jgi:hypothetical protein
MSVSVDGSIADREGALGWTTPSEELFRFHLALASELGGYPCGHRLYETMLVDSQITSACPSRSTLVTTSSTSSSPDPAIAGLFRRSVRTPTIMSAAVAGTTFRPTPSYGCCSYVKHGIGAGALVAIVVELGAGAAASGAAAGGATSRSFQTRRARWRLRQRSASLRDLPSACLRAR